MATVKVLAKHREIKQTVTFASITLCNKWRGKTKKVYEAGYGMALGVFSGTAIKPGHFIHSACLSTKRRALSGKSIAFKVTLC